MAGDRRRGFWAGFLIGSALAALLALGLALTFRSLTAPPEIEPAALSAPAEPVAPEAVAEVPAPAALLRPASSASLIGRGPAEDRAPGGAALGPASRGPAEGASLVPLPAE